MWARITNTFKQSQDIDDPSGSRSSQGDVMSKVLEQHPNLSIFHSKDTSNVLPASPARKLIGAMIGTNDPEDHYPWESSPVEVPSPKALPNSSESTEKKEIPPIARSPTTNNRTPAHATSSNPNSNPASVRSILRRPRTPGTGQNVRFFSTDAYKFISPDSSFATNKEDAGSGVDLCGGSGPVLGEGEKREAAGAEDSDSDNAVRPTMSELFEDAPGRPPVFSPPIHKSSTSISLADNAPSTVDSPSFTLRPSDSSLMLPVPPPDLSNLFDISAEEDLPSIPIGSEMPLSDGAVELISEDDDERHGRLTSMPFSRDNTMQANVHRDLEDVDDVFHSAEHGTAAYSPYGSSRAVQEGTLFHSFIDKTWAASPLGQQPSSPRSSESPSAYARPGGPDADLPHQERPKGKKKSGLARGMLQALSEMELNDSGSDTEAQDIGGADPVFPDHVETDESNPFILNNTAYYTPQTKSPATHHSVGATPGGPPTALNAGRTSRQEQLVYNLRMQLALHQEMCAQFEVDLNARDELVDLLTTRAQKAEQDGQKRKTVMRGWRQKVEALEKACKGLQEELDRSRQDSMDRIALDEANDEAMRTLHLKIQELEKGREEWRAEEARYREEVQRFSEALEGREDAWAATENTSAQTTPQRADEGNQDRDNCSGTAWPKERALLLSRIEQLQGLEAEHGMLKTELEAQWKHTEDATEKIEQLEQENGALQQHVSVLEDRISTLEVRWNEGENKKTEIEGELQDLWDAKEVAERERSEMVEQLKTMEQDHRYALDTVARLEQNLRQREAEISDYSKRLAEREIALEQLHEEMSTIKREQARALEKQARERQDAFRLAVETKHELETTVKEKAESEVTLHTLTGRSKILQDEVDQLRRHVQELQQESADKEVKILQLTKQRAQDREDLNGLNIALDAKQQELELLKRRHGLRGTAGSTPAQPSKTAKLRRDSAVFSTPGLFKPPSRFSDTESQTEAPSATPRVAALGKTNAPNGNVAVKSRRRTNYVPAAKSRALIGDTPTPKAVRRRASATHSLSRSSAKPAAPNADLRRASSATLPDDVSAKALDDDGTAASEEGSEKENVGGRLSTRTTSRIPVPS